MESQRQEKALNFQNVSKKMALLEDKKALIFGIANNRSIAYGIAKKLQSEGSAIGIAYGADNLKKRIDPIAQELDAEFSIKCDVTNEDEIDKTFSIVEEKFDNIDILVHSIAFAPESDLKCPVIDVSKEGFNTALTVSAYSLIALSRRAYKLMKKGGSIITMTYFGSTKVIINYNLMGIAKAALEASVRYLAFDLGNKNIRVNAISAGPIRTLASSGVKGFKELFSKFAERVPLKNEITKEDVGDVALFLASNLSKKITGEIIFVDGGYNIIGY
ncbi:MAG: enoyl-ACP reductase [Deferribacterota bacterium]|nr:enoyl-ACP reductase [Deferribacterota bacterium]